MGRKIRQRRGLFITFEGIEGSGKTTQCLRLAKTLREQRTTVVETREPGGTPFAESIRRLLLQNPSSTSEPVSPWCEAFLILAARRQHVAQRVQPALQNGAVVVCDRFSDSTLAYQGYARGLDRRMLERLSLLASEGLTPDLTLLFDMAVSEGLARREHDERHGTRQNRIDRESQAFHNRVRQGFLDLARRHRRRIHVLDGRLDPDLLSQQVWALVAPLLKKRRKE
jgi:dTMP kinase